ncbi:MAG: glycosyltransferase [bacterium]
MSIAIVHNYLNQMGGAERVVAVFHEIFPEAPIYTTILDKNILPSELANADIRPSWMQKLPELKKHFKKYLLFYPYAIESFDLRDYDLIISSSSAFAKGALKKKGALHICYCYTPMRFVWDFQNYIKNEELNLFYEILLSPIIFHLKIWDLKTRNRPDCYIAISNVVKARIKSIYGKDAEIIFPPVEVNKFYVKERGENFYLIVSRLNPYKRIELAVQAFNSLGLPLKIIGTGPYLKTLMRMAGPNIEFLGRLTDNEIADYYASCKALIFPGEEDFGLTPLEANASGRPVIAYKGGGALDTVQEGLNGIFFDNNSIEALIDAVKAMENGKYEFSPHKIREHAMNFDKQIFIQKFKKFVIEKYSNFQSQK